MSSTTVKRKIYSFVSLESVQNNGLTPAQAMVTSEIDYRNYDSLSSKYAYVGTHEIFIEVPDNIGSVAADSLEVELQKMRAAHHKEQQRLIDTISTLRLLAAPKEGEVVVDDKDLRAPAAPSKFHDADEAEEVNDDQNDIPF